MESKVFGNKLALLTSHCGNDNDYKGWVVC